MRKNSIPLLAAAVLCEFIATATAQAPAAEVLCLPSEYAPMSAKALLGCENADSSAPVLWFACRWCHSGSDIGGPWVEFTSNQGPIASVLGLPVPATPESREVVEIHSDNSAGSLAVNNGSFDVHLLAACSAGDVLDVPSTYAEFLAVAGCDVPAWAINCIDDARPGVQFNVGGGICLTTILGLNGSAGQHNLSQFMGVGSSIWLDCITETGLEFRAGFGFVGGQQAIELRK